MSSVRKAGEADLNPDTPYSNTGVAKTSAAADEQMSDYRRSFQDFHDKFEPKRQARREAARTSMGDSYKTDITTYDFKSHGRGRFDLQDVKHLREQGYSDDAIAEYSSSLNKNQLGEGLRQNHGKFAGQHAYEDMAEGAKISDHDVGTGFNISDVNYLRRQGFSDKEIAQHAHESVLKGGKRHGNAMAKFMDSQGYLDYYHGDWKKAKGQAASRSAASSQTSPSAAPSQNTENTQQPAPAQPAPGSSDPNEFKENYMGNMPKEGGLFVKDSFDARGGTLTNSGDLTAGRDITFDNSVTNQNTLNHFGGDVRQFTYNAPGFNGGGENGGGTGDGSGGGQYPTMNSYKDPALNATPVSAATMAGFYRPSDSPAAAAKRTALHSELNRGKQEKYQNAGSSVAEKYVKSADRFNNIDTKALSANLAVQPFVDEARSNIITSDTFGDIWNFQPDSFEMADAFVKPEQPDFDKMFKKITDKITGG